MSALITRPMTPPMMIQIPMPIQFCMSLRESE
jgi:hypothetical protein